MKFRRLIFANLFRKKIRLILTVGSFAIALVLFMFLAVVRSAFSRGTEIAGADRLAHRSRVRRHSALCRTAYERFGQHSGSNPRRDRMCRLVPRCPPTREGGDG